MSQQVSAAQKQSMGHTSGKQSAQQQSGAKHPEKKDTRTVFEPASKVAVLGYN